MEKWTTSWKSLVIMFAQQGSDPQDELYNNVNGLAVVWAHQGKEERRNDLPDVELVSLPLQRRRRRVLKVVQRLHVDREGQVVDDQVAVLRLEVGNSTWTATTVANIIKLRRSTGLCQCLWMPHTVIY